MNINWSVVATIAAPIVALFVGVALNRLLARKARLIAYFTHASVFQISGPNPIQIHTHGIVIKNVGKKSATDIRVRHNILPGNFNVFPNIEYQVNALRGGGSEIVFPTLVPNEQVSIAYLYFPPTLYSQIHSGIRHSDGFATEVTVLPMLQYPPWLKRLLWFLIILGFVAFIYILFEAGSTSIGILHRLTSGRT